MTTTTPLKPAQPKTADKPAADAAAGKTKAKPPTARTHKDRTNKDAPTNTDKAFFRVKLGNLEFSSLHGEVLKGSYVWLATDRFSTAKILLNDPDGSLLPTLKDQNDVEVELGFVGGPKRNTFVGKVLRFGRKLPYATIIIAADPSAQLAQQATPGTLYAKEEPKEKQERKLPSLVDLAEFTDAVADNPALAATLKLLDEVSLVASEGKPSAPPAEQFALKHSQDLKFAKDTKFATAEQGQSRLQKSDLQAATQSAAEQGDVVVTRGNTVRQVQPGRGEPSGLVLDYQANRAAFVGRPEVLKRTPLQLMSGYGAIAVTGWNANDKRSVGATVVVPGAASVHPTGNIAVPEWGQIAISDPIFPGCLYTWGDATKNGSRVPENKAIMEGIIKIAQTLQQLTEQYNNGSKFRVNSWYRNPAANAAAGGATNSRHLSGDAVDFVGGNWQQVFRALSTSYDGGLGDGRHIGFIHIDRGSKRRWGY